MEENKQENNVTSEVNETNEVDEATKKKKKKIFTIVLSVLAIVVGLYAYDMTRYESTDDAYVETTTVSVAPKISGEIVEVYVKDNDYVKAGQPIAKIDARDYQVAFDQAEAAYQRKILDQKNAKASLEAVNSELAVAKKDVERYTNLYAAGAVSKQTLDNARTRYANLSANQTTATQNIFSSGKNVADADLKTLKAQRDAAALHLSYTTIYAPQDGTVSAKRVEKGMQVSAGSPLFTLVPHEVWVVANFKETQLTNMRPGMAVTMKIDTYPHHKFQGKIDSIQRSSGAKSSLFPPENAVGSFVKIVQRIPVKIVFTEKFDTNKYMVTPGMSVEPKVKVR
jgi:membrane fusion protein (multidrug efflux system)